MNKTLSVITLITLLFSTQKLISQTVDDGNFETPQLTSIIGAADPISTDGTTTVYINPSDTSGWYVDGASTSTPATVTLINQGLLGPLLSPISGDSTQYMALNGLALNVGSLTPGTLGGVAENITTVAGQTYTVTYEAGALRVDLLPTSDQAVLSAGVDGVTVTSSGNGALINLSVGTMEDESFTFTATGTESTLHFYEPDALLADVGGVAIDDVSITPVPEPKQYTALFVCFCLLLIVVRKLRIANNFILHGAAKSAFEETLSSETKE